LIGVPPVTTANLSGSVPDKAARRTADIIPFPARAKPAEPTPQQRLVGALESLNAALAEQRTAVAAWREVLAELKTTTAGLHDSLRRYRANLLTLGSSVSALQAMARSLEQWADGVTATGGLAGAMPSASDGGTAVPALPAARGRGAQRTEPGSTPT
jgi:hypothetical protein